MTQPEIIREPADLTGRIKPARAALGLGQMRYADSVGLSQRQVHLWESGGSEPLLSSAIRIAGALGYDLALVPREDRP